MRTHHFPTTARGPDYGAPLFTALREACAADWRAYVRHRFVAGLGDGSLPRAAFLAYLRQDYLFLIHFARAWALAAVKAEHVDELRQAAGAVHALIDAELRLHVGVCAAEGVPEAELAATPEAQETLAYTRFVIDAGLSGDLLDLLAALMPCVLGYGEIGLRLGDEAAASTPYGDWIETYRGEPYQEICAAAASLFETVAARRIGPEPAASPRWPGLVRRFGTACRLEAAFWDMGLRAGRAEAA